MFNVGLGRSASQKALELINEPLSNDGLIMPIKVIHMLIIHIPCTAQDFLVTTFIYECEIGFTIPKYFVKAIKESEQHDIKNERVEIPPAM